MSARPGFVLTAAGGETLEAARVILATGGRSLPKTGSDGGGYALARGARAHGHLRGSSPASSRSRCRRARPLRPQRAQRAGHARGARGLGPAPGLVHRRDCSARTSGSPGPRCSTSAATSSMRGSTTRRPRSSQAGCPARPRTRWTRAPRPARSRTVAGFLAGRMPERLARALCARGGRRPGPPGHRLTREARRALVRTVTEMPLPVTGDRGFNFAEVTAGGVPLAELDLATMDSRRCPGLSSAARSATWTAASAGSTSSGPGPADTSPARACPDRPHVRARDAGAPRSTARSGTRSRPRAGGRRHRCTRER